jgi:hypothetical protein
MWNVSVKKNNKTNKVINYGVKVPNFKYRFCDKVYDTCLWIFDETNEIIDTLY